MSKSIQQNNMIKLAQKYFHNHLHTELKNVRESSWFIDWEDMYCNTKPQPPANAEYVVYIFNYFLDSFPKCFGLKLGDSLKRLREILVTNSQFTIKNDDIKCFKDQRNIELNEIIPLNMILPSESYINMEINFNYDLRISTTNKKIGYYYFSQIEQFLTDPVSFPQFIEHLYNFQNSEKGGKIFLGIQSAGVIKGIYIKDQDLFRQTLVEAIICLSNGKIDMKNNVDISFYRVKRYSTQNSPINPYEPWKMVILKVKGKNKQLIKFQRPSIYQCQFFVNLVNNFYNNDFFLKLQTQLQRSYTELNYKLRNLQSEIQLQHQQTKNEMMISTRSPVKTNINTQIDPVNLLLYFISLPREAKLKYFNQFCLKHELFIQHHNQLQVQMQINHIKLGTLGFEQRLYYYFLKSCIWWKSVQNKYIQLLEFTDLHQQEWWAQMDLRYQQEAYIGFPCDRLNYLEKTMFLKQLQEKGSILSRNDRLQLLEQQEAVQKQEQNQSLQFDQLSKKEGDENYLTNQIQVIQQRKNNQEIEQIQETQIQFQNKNYQNNSKSIIFGDTSFIVRLQKQKRKNIIKNKLIFEEKNKNKNIYQKYKQNSESNELTIDNIYTTRAEFCNNSKYNNIKEDLLHKFDSPEKDKKTCNQDEWLKSTLIKESTNVSYHENIYLFSNKVELSSYYDEANSNQIQQPQQIDGSLSAQEFADFFQSTDSFTQIDKERQSKQVQISYISKPKKTYLEFSQPISFLPNVKCSSKLKQLIN